MKWYDMALMAVTNLWRRKLRTALTLIGVMIGTASIVVMVSMGLGLNQSFMESFGSSSSLTTINVYDDNYYNSSSNNTKTQLNDAVITQFRRIPHVTAATPLMDVWGLDLRMGKYQSWTSITGVDISVLPQFGIKLSEGAFPQAGQGSRVSTLNVLMGFGVRDSFYKVSSDGSWGGNMDVTDVDWLAAKYTLNMSLYSGWDGTGDMPVKKYKMAVAGLTAQSETYDEHSWRIYADIADIKKIVKENRKEFQDRGMKTSSYQQAWVKVDDVSNVRTALKEIQDMGYNAQSIMDMVQSTQEMMNNIQLLLGGIGAIAMLAAIPGIANTMLMSVYERTREIGIMKVLGCRLSNIRLLFLGEAGLIGLIGGALGMGMSLGLSALLNTFFAGGGGDTLGLYNMRSVIPAWLVLLSLVFAFFIGVASGFYPAQRAMKLSALAAIRNED